MGGAVARRLAPSATPHALDVAIAERCAACPHIEAAWVSANRRAFYVQTVVGCKTRTEKNWTYREPLYATPEQAREASEVVARIKSAHSDVDGYQVGYVFRSGPSWVEVYRRARP